MSKPVICIGAALVDELFHATDDLLPATTNDAIVTKTAGGVSRNIAQQLSLLDVPVELISVFGNDSDADWLRKTCRDAGVGLNASITKEGLSGKYTGILNKDGSLFSAFLTNSYTHLIVQEYLNKHTDLLRTAMYIIADANISVATAVWLLNFSNETGIPFILEPTSVPYVKKFSDTNFDGLYMVTPNEDELPALCSEAAVSTEKQVDELLNKNIQNVWWHSGINGSIFYSKERTLKLNAPAVNVRDCTGAGDASLSGFILGKYLGKEDMDCLKLAHTLSAEILQVNGAITPHLDQKTLLQKVNQYFPD